jgi:hypothetical protein
MNQLKIDAVEQGIESLIRGTTVDETLSSISDLSPTEAELINIANRVMLLGESRISPQAMDKSRERISARAAEYQGSLSAHNPPIDERNPFRKLKRLVVGQWALHRVVVKLMIILGMTALFLMFSEGLAVTSAKSLPGEPLYQVKRVVEEIQIHLVPGSQNRFELEASFNLKRVEEVLLLLKLQQVQAISFKGALETINDKTWTVSGIPVLIESDTVFASGQSGSQDFTLGSIVEVEGMTSTTGEVVAREIHLREYLYRGIVERIEHRSWTVSGVLLTLMPNTTIDEDIAIGDHVTVWVHSNDDGSFALSIEKDAGEDPIATNTPAHPTAEWTDDGYSGEHEEATITVDPGETAEEGESSDADKRSSITETPEPPESDVRLTQTPEPSDSDEHESGTVTPENHPEAEPVDGLDYDP